MKQKKRANLDMKIGRNDPCPCGSGKKYKKCCLEKMSYTIGPSIPFEVIEKYQEHLKRERERVLKFGQVKSDIGTEYKGKNVIAVGSRIYFTDKPFFSDFLFEYLSIKLGEEWRKTELAKPFEEQHQIMQWWKKACEFADKYDGTKGVTPNGFLAAFVTFAYDLYIVENNSRLDENLFNRLKQKSQFQGARHELFAEATCLRAGYIIEHEDQTDITKRHVEFNAIHKMSKQKISVEAKSKHRPGILGFPGEVQIEEELSLRFGTLINAAIAKKPEYPLVIFLDTNLSTKIADQIFNPSSVDPFKPSEFMDRLIDKIRRENVGKEPYNLLVFTNHPHHYAKEDETDPKKHLLSIMPQISVKIAEYPDAILELNEAARKYGNIPIELPKSKG